MKEVKWSDRTAALEQVLDVLKRHSKVSGDGRDYIDIVSVLKLSLADSNQAVRGLFGDVRVSMCSPGVSALTRVSACVCVRPPPCVCR
jgi:hypothetical protein